MVKDKKPRVRNGLPPSRRTYNGPRFRLGGLDFRLAAAEWSQRQTEITRAMLAPNPVCYNSV